MHDYLPAIAHRMDPSACFIVAGYLFHEAPTCTGRICDLVALPAVFPLGHAISWLLDGIDHLFVWPEFIVTQGAGTA